MPASALFRLSVAALSAGDNVVIGRAIGQARVVNSVAVVLLTSV